MVSSSKGETYLGITEYIGQYTKKPVVSSSKGETYVGTTEYIGQYTKVSVVSSSKGDKVSCLDHRVH